VEVGFIFDFEFHCKVSGYSGNVGTDALGVQNHMMFTTYDRDNDPWIDNCATRYGGGFWYITCGYGLINAAGWEFRWYWPEPEATYYLQLQASRMWLMCH